MGSTCAGLASSAECERLEQCANTAEQRAVSQPSRSEQRVRRPAEHNDQGVGILLPVPATPYAPRTYDAPGDWRFDANSLVVVNADNRAQDLRRLSYTVESVDIEPDGDLNNAVAGTPQTRR